MAKKKTDRPAAEKACSPDAPADRYPLWSDVPPKQRELNAALLRRASGKAAEMLQRLVVDREVDAYLSYANVVAVRRLGFNDHGPIHARITTYNALKLIDLLEERGVSTSLVDEEVGALDDSRVAVALGCFLHDIGMGVARENHEWHSITLADDIISRYLAALYPPGDPLRLALRPLIHEIIVGHMGHSRIHSIEAGIVLVADGTDMSRGRSRIPTLLDRDPAVGDIHRHSARAIQRVEITEGDAKPIRISVKMENVTGLFQVEEILMSKIKASPVMPYIELCAVVGEEKPRFYLK